MEVKEVLISKLKPQANNPRHHPQPQIKKLVEIIQKTGFRVPIMVDKDFNIIAGEGRYKAALRLKMEAVPVIMHADLNPEQATALGLADNRLAELSDWNQDKLQAALEQLQNTAWQEFTGFDMPEVEMLVSDKKQPARMNFQEYWKSPKKNNSKDLLKYKKFEELSIKPVFKKDMLFELGSHRLLCGDATNKTDYQRLCGGNLVDMVFTDPPFNLSASHISPKILNKKTFCEGGGEMSKQQFKEFLTRVFENLVLVSKPNSLHYIFMDWRSSLNILAVGEKIYKAGLQNICVWHKTQMGLGAFYRSANEFVFVFSNNNALQDVHQWVAILKPENQPHTNNIRLGKYGRTRTNVWSYPSGIIEGLCSNSTHHAHPTVKPLEMITEGIKDCTNTGQLVLDPFVGSGTTILACEQSSRVCYAMDKSPEFCDLALARWERLTGKKAVEIKNNEYAGQPA